MLYHLHEMQHHAFAPMRMLAEAMQSVYSHPWVPMAYTKFGRTVAATAELVERTTRRYPKPPFNLHTTTVDGESVHVVEQVAKATPFCNLLHFKRSVEGRKDPKVLLLAPMSGHFATLLRGTVETMLHEHDVYITDWIDTRNVPLSHGDFTLDDYIDLLVEFMEFLGPDTHVMAVCQPSVPMLAAVSLMAADNNPNQPRSMLMMGGPIDTRVNPTKVNDVATHKPFSWFERTVIHTVPMNYPGHGRRVYPGFLQLHGFMSMNLERHVGEHVKLYQNMVKGDGDSAAQHREFYDEYLSVMDLPADYYLETIRKVFQEHHLARGIMVSRDRKVDPGAIRHTALMTIEGEKDDITGVGQTKAAHALCCNLAPEKQRYHLQPKVGHYGVFNGRRWREEVYPNVREFIRQHDRG
ncbi:Polyhydroxyalkanoic acid synthase [Paramagnetospirillum magnetotacticum MS-1]|uniref:Polyhydroxyalkanoic acid synthase n=2 Tax=Paramagnetospirillum magnetotacticum TaxID=188 RepID=A0A0C2YYC0_PARME|nr:polyhydroxyalkanoate depolymerase [Paramagnetospirillum magnetotacticum]AAO62350.1 PhaZ1 [Paramagnetospirillum magnetotacticum]KIL99645.1 Polyhydroxyalkanoic acid synthase [Paramagnetospirillum magnetotacticum MS-1]